MTPDAVPKMTLDEAVQLLTEKKASLKTPELKKLLIGFGYSVTRKGSAGHHVVTHPKLVAYKFFTLNFDGGHGGETIKKTYIGHVKKHLAEFKEHLEELGYE